MTITKETILWRTFTLLGAGEVLVREADPEDAQGLRRMFSRCSQETIYLRFHLFLPSVPERLIGYLVRDTEDGGRALVVVCKNEIFGHAMYPRDEERDHEAEFAIVAEDERQASGLGALLLSEIAEEAKRAGVETFMGIVQAKNRQILKLTLRILPGRICSFRGGTCVIRAPLATPLAEAGLGGEGGP